MVTEAERQAIVDEEQLRLLPVFYWVLGGVDIFVSLYGLVYVAFGVFFALMPWESSGSAGEPPPAFMGWFFFAIGATFMLAFGIFAGLKIASGFSIKARRRRTFSLVVAGLSCLSMPFGTIVGVWTFIVLLRPSVEALYDSSVMNTASHSAGPEDDAQAAR